MNFDEFSTAPCILPPSTVGGQCAGIDPRCLDLEWAAAHLETCPGASSIIGFAVTPESGVIEVGGTIPFSASLLFSNGKSKDVTASALWDVSDSGIATIDNQGVASGISVGATTVQASYGTLIGFAQVNVVVHCVQAGLDIVLVVDRCAAMGTTDAGGMTLLDLTKRAAKALVGSATFAGGKDRISVVSCAGIYRSNATPAYEANATSHFILSSVEQDVIAAIDAIELGKVYYDIPGGEYGSEAASGIGAGLTKAKEELLANGRADARKLIVYVGTGYETYCTPDPSTVAAEIAALNWQLAGISLGEPVSYLTCGNGAQTTSWDYVESLVTCNLFWGVDDLADLPNVFAEVIYLLCGKAAANDACVYYVAPAVDPVPVWNYRDQLDYQGLINWDVIDGYVDLIGIEMYAFFPTRGGLFLDMIGTDLIERKQPVGTIQSKQLFNFGRGRYRLTFELAGNQRVRRSGDSIRVSVGNLFDKEITIQNWDQPFTLYSYDFGVSNATAAKIVFAHEKLRNSVNAGILLDNVKLVNLDTGAILLNDTFDNENPI